MTYNTKKGRTERLILGLGSSCVVDHGTNMPQETSSYSDTQSFDIDDSTKEIKTTFFCNSSAKLRVRVSPLSSTFSTSIALDIPGMTIESTESRYKFDIATEREYGEFSVPTGKKLTVIINRQGYENYSTTIEPAYEGQVIEITAHLRKAQNTLRGQCLNGDELPLPFALVLVTQNKMAKALAYSDQNGNFTAYSIPDDNIEVQIAKLGYKPLEIQNIDPTKFLMLKLESVTFGDELETFYGKCIDSNGNPVENVSVTIVLSSSDKTKLIPCFSQTLAQTNKDGFFTIDNLQKHSKIKMLKLKHQNYKKIVLRDISIHSAASDPLILKMDRIEASEDAN